MSYQAVVLLSGGLDSVFNLYKAREKWGHEILSLCLNYGQKAWSQEFKAAQYFCDQLNLSLQALDVKDVFLGSSSSLTSHAPIPTEEVDINSLEASEKTAEKVWVPNRNGVLLNIAACLAESHGASFIVPGFNSEEAATFPDNSVEYIEKMNACLKLSTANGVQVKCFSQDMHKAEMVVQMKAWNIDRDKIWSCYKDGDRPCEQCESCQRFQRAWTQGR